MSNNPVHTSMFNKIDKFDVEHISLAKKADMILVAPATANTIGKLANGIADNLLTTVIMASRSKVAFAAAMNTEMYNNPINQRNMKTLESIGYEFIKPGVGLLACGDVGTGKMAEPADIVEYVISSFVEKDLEGKKVLITAGPTIEPLDPVRFITNHSSGKMGYSLAKEAKDRGADVTLITGPSCLTPPKGVNVVDINTTKEMFDKVGEYFRDTDILIKSAAPSDFKPENYSDKKIKKTDKQEKGMTLKLEPNPDIAAYYGKLKKDQITVGFAAETDNVYEYAKGKLERKNFDLIVANDITKSGAGFKSDTNIITIIDRDFNKTDYPIMDKKEVAKIIIDETVKLLNNKSKS